MRLRTRIRESSQKTAQKRTDSDHEQVFLSAGGMRSGRDERGHSLYTSPKLRSSVDYRFGEQSGNSMFGTNACDFTEMTFAWHHALF